MGVVNGFNYMPEYTGSYLGVQKRQAFIDVLDFVHSHSAVVRFAQLLAGYDLQQFQ